MVVLQEIAKKKEGVMVPHHLSSTAPPNSLAKLI
jgi:hypothetical protein